MLDGSLFLWHSAATAGFASSLDIYSDSSMGNTCELSALRYVIVNDANLKSQTYCAECGTNIGQRYIRKIDSRSVFCDVACYRCAMEKPMSCFGGEGANLFAASHRQGETN